jgi:hypothetical protein
MSNYMAIGTVTAALELTLQGPVAAAVGGGKVTSDRPAGAGFKPTKGVNLYCYAVVPNPAWRGGDLPTRASGGTLVRVPQAGVDLFYLMTGYGDDSALEPQRAIAAVVATLQADPTITKQTIDLVVQQANLGANPIHPELKTSDLGDQVELVRLCPIEMSTEELSKLWTVFESPYSLSVAYRAGVVLLNPPGSVASGPPVLSRAIDVLSAVAPHVDSVVSAAGAGMDITTASQVLVRGSGFASGSPLVRLAAGDVVPDRATDLQISVTLPNGLAAGNQGLQVVEQLYLGNPPQPHPGPASNLVHFVLHPTITAVNHGAGTPAGGGLINITVAATLDVSVTPTQSLLLLLRDPASGRLIGMFLSPSLNAPTNAPSFNIRVAPGTYAVQVQVDGAASQRLNPPQVTLA